MNGEWIEFLNWYLPAFPCSHYTGEGMLWPVLWWKCECLSDLMNVCIAGRTPKLKLSLKLALALNLNLASQRQPKGNLGKLGENDRGQTYSAVVCVELMFSVFLMSIYV